MRGKPRPSDLVIFSVAAHLSPNQPRPHDFAARSRYLSAIQKDYRQQQVDFEFFLHASIVSGQPWGQAASKMRFTASYICLPSLS